MMSCTFEEFFKKASQFSPYPYQKLLATEDEIPDMISIPTGAGKTEAAVLCMWMWRRQNPHTKQHTPRRLVYCLPMRSLVEQTKKRICKYVNNLNMDEKVRVITLMGGDIDTDYVLHPEADMVILGTQDMLLSRALNRGYASGPFKWPIEFGLLNNDCLWIMDEIQLMHDGLATSVQLDAFRKKMGTYGPPHKTVWMSATINEQNLLDTVDSQSAGNVQITRLGDNDLLDPVLKKKNTAEKILRIMDFKKEENAYGRSEAEKIINMHECDTMTLVIVNTVKSAQSLYEQAERILDKKNKRIDLLLLHSRFRGHDRQIIMDKIYNQDKNVIVITTQVAEAGMDISAKTLITENAPWPSLIQRFGRCNRRGEYNTANIYIIPLSADASVPYDKKNIDESWKIIKQKEEKSMAPLNIEFGGEASRVYGSVIRRPDIINLFDTSPDISGGYTDISRYVRSNEESKDAHVFWRKWDKNEKIPNYKVRKDEMCSVPIYDIKNRQRMYIYDHTGEMWKKIEGKDVQPGQIILLHCDNGGYTNDCGWNPKSKDHVMELYRDTNNGYANGDPLSQNNKRLITLRDHTTNVVREMANINSHMEYGVEWPKDMLTKASILHDIGKAHHVFQDAIKDENKISRTIYAKCKSMKKYTIANFRHEAISAMAILKKAYNKKDYDNTDWCLVAYIVASHHGKVRMSMRNPVGIKDGTEYIAGVSVDSTCTIPNFLTATVGNSADDRLKISDWSEDRLDIGHSIAKIGSPGLPNNGASWIQMTHELLATYGPFRLAYLEAVLRVADWRASAKEEDENA